MKKKLYLLTVLLTLALLLVATGCGSRPGTSEPPAQNTPGPAEPQPVDVVSLVEDRCARCHNLDRVTRERDADLWPGIVTDMVKKSPGLLNDEEYELVVEYFQKNYGK